MNIEKVGLLATEARPRKIDFIKYSNKKSYVSNKENCIEDCFNKSLTRENSLVSLNFLA